MSTNHDHDHDHVHGGGGHGGGTHDHGGATHDHDHVHGVSSGVEGSYLGDSDESLGTGLVARLSPLFKLVGDQRGLLWTTVLIGALNQILVVILGALGAWIVGQAIAGASWETLKPAAIVIAVMIIPRAFLPWADTVFAHLMAFRALVKIRTSVTQAFVRLAPGGLLQNRSGDLGSRVIGDVELTEVFFAHTLPQLIVAVSVPFISLILLAWCHWSLPLLLIPVALLVVSIPKFFEKRASREGNLVRSTLGELSADITDRVQGLHEVLGFNAGPRAISEIAQTERRLYDVQLKHVTRAGHERNLTDFALGAGVFVVMIAASMLVISGGMQAALFPVAVTIAGLSLAPLAKVVEVARDLNVVAAAAMRIKNLVERVPVVDEVEATDADFVEMESIEPTVSFDSVSFTYDNADSAALSDVSFDVAAGEMVALVGKSGAGKTTTAHLAMRFWDPGSGSVSVGGRDLKGLAGDVRRELMTLVPQEVYLFHGSLRSNLILGAPDASDEQIFAALDQAAIGDFVRSLDDGLDTFVGERGASLSGGQRQRIAMARAILADRPILVLDEPVAHLDSETELALADALQAGRQGRTIILIAHRLSTIRLADRIVMLDQGRVVDAGTHDELVAKRGPYWDLVRPQLETQLEASS